MDVESLHTVKRFVSSLVLISFCFSVILNTGLRTAAEPAPPKPRNIIMMIMDGTNSSAINLARMYKGAPLALDEIVVGGARTASLKSAITDSAAAGTALATGNKTTADAIGMVPILGKGSGKSDRFVPVTNVLEAAQAGGKATGIVATAPVQHATPASYSAHVTNRNNFDDIAEQQVFQKIDVVLGGGLTSLQAKNRNDHEDLVKVIRNEGYQWVENREQLRKSASAKKIWGAFAENDLAYHFDRAQLRAGEPTLADMTETAIHTLNRTEHGFFLFIEGSKVDWAAHKNDPVGMISEVLGFDEAVQRAVQFAKKDRNTLVIAVTDHGNSGLSIGSRATDKTYAITPREKFVQPLRKAKLTVEGALKKFPDDVVAAAVAYGLDDLSAKEKRALKSTKQPDEVMVRLMAKRANLGLTTHGHTGEDVFLYAFGPGKPSGLVENTDIAKWISRGLGVDLQQQTKVKFVNAVDWYGTRGYETSIDARDTANPVFVARKNGVELRYPKNKNYYIHAGKKIVTNGVTVFSGKDDVFVSVD